ncbi:MAG TPA: endo alpha-1,4 polygalactosaminidase [bacterium]|nr:endo alpha-1,4 polygalactosaminidase [bacterium]
MHTITRSLILLFVMSALAMCQTSGDGDDDDDAGGDIWQPAPGTSWQWQLSGAVDASFDVAMYDIDLFENDATTIQALQADGRVVICYFSAGSFEDWREDAVEFPPDALGAPLDDWEGEWWLDIADETVRQIMTARLDLAAAKGCDGVEPDNMDGYANDNGLGLSADDQLDYNRFIAEQAHARGLSVGLKNDVDQLDNLVENFDWALNEECHVYDECELYDAFIEAGKAVFNAEYVDEWADAEALAAELCGAYPELDTIIKEWDLTARRLACE